MKRGVLKASNTPSASHPPLLDTFLKRNEEGNEHPVCFAATPLRYISEKK